MQSFIITNFILFKIYFCSNLLVLASSNVNNEKYNGGSVSQFLDGEIYLLLCAAVKFALYSYIIQI